MSLYWKSFCWKSICSMLLYWMSLLCWPNFTKLYITILNDVMPNVIMLNVIILNVVAPSAMRQCLNVDAQKILSFIFFIQMRKISFKTLSMSSPGKPRKIPTRLMLKARNPYWKGRLNTIECRGRISTVRNPYWKGRLDTVECRGKISTLDLL